MTTDLSQASLMYLMDIYNPVEIKTLQFNTRLSEASQQDFPPFYGLPVGRSGSFSVSSLPRGPGLESENNRH